MIADQARKRIWGWMMFDWASQPYNTLLLTFIFAPYFAEIVSGNLIAQGGADADAKAMAQGYWGWGLTISGLAIALIAPVLGAIADSAGRRMPYVYAFSLLYIVGAAGLWLAVPGTENVVLVLGIFIVGLVGMEFATIFTNAMLPGLAPRAEIGRISGSGFAVGYWGGFTSLVLTLLFLAESKNGTTLLGIKPILGLDAELRQGTRSVGPLAALWYLVFMIPFSLWVREVKPKVQRAQGVIRKGLQGLAKTIKRLPDSPSLACYLASSMFYRDALNGMYTFGGVYAYGVLGWSVIDVGIFGIIAVVAGAVASYLGGFADRRFGPKLVITVAIIVLIIAAIGIVSIGRDALFGIALPEGSAAPDWAFRFCGLLIGAAGGVLQAASRTMLIRQGNPARMTEAFGLYALTGKATSFLAPMLIAIATNLSESQRIGVSPVIALFILGLVLLFWVKPEGEDDSIWASAT